ncbi:MAG TPA: SDR family NAD(P)-dependent oxidoreductase, partial [Stellaceae bacterium]|nr:SDR family NAD(P)-dependent oxidoreductase [Stellaceae bacterium]
MGLLADKVAIIAGGTSGIGARIAEVFLAEGARLTIASPMREEGEALARRLGAGVRFHYSDVSCEADVQSLIESTVADTGRLDVMVNNAGIAGHFASIARLDLEQYERTLAVVLKGVMLGTKHAARIMLPRGAGSIINTGSVAGSRAGFGPYDYSAAKAAVIHFTRCAAVELGEHGVRANSISPGGIATGIFGKAMQLDQDAIARSD